MKPKLPNTGIEVVGSVPWGTHFTMLYETPQDLTDVVVRFLAAGLEADELCECLPCDPKGEAAVRQALRARVSDFDARAARGQIQFTSAHEFYTPNGRFDLDRLLGLWSEKLAWLATQDVGLRVTGDARWVTSADMATFLDYERAVHELMRKTRMLVMCTYPLASRTATDVFDVANEHHFAIARRHGDWDVLATTQASQPTKLASRSREKPPTRRVITPKPAARRRVRIMIVDDHPVVRAGVRAILEDERDLEVVAEATNGAEALQLYETVVPDVVLMDLRLPVLDGIETMRSIRAINPHAAVVALTTFVGDADVYRAVEAGASGYLLKDTLGENLVSAVRAVAAGERFIPSDIASRLAQFIAAPALTPREREVLDLAAQGLRNRDIARRIGRTEATVKVHFKHVTEKLGVHDRTAAVAVALKRGLVHLGEQPGPSTTRVVEKD